MNLKFRNPIWKKKNYLKVKHKEYETAVKLAEPYVDFNTLVMICEIRNDMDLLESYLNKFENTVRILPFFFHSNFLTWNYFYFILFCVWKFSEICRICDQIFHGEKEAQLFAQKQILASQRHLGLFGQVPLHRLDKRLQERSVQ